MTNAEEQALIQKLAGNDSAFAAEYSAPNRKWFVGKFIDSLESQSTPDSEMEHDGSNLRAMISFSLCRARKDVGYSHTYNKLRTFGALSSVG